MQVENQKEAVPFFHYVQLYAKLDPEQVIARLPFADFDGARFTLKLLGREYRLRWPAYALELEDGEKEPPVPVQTFLLRCLIEGKNEGWAGQWKTFRQMPWGELYHKPYTGRVLTRAAMAFGPRMADFRAAAEKLGAEPVKHGDAGFCFDFMGPYRIQILIWEGDDEFAPSAQVLYSDNFADGFSAEDRVVAADILIRHIQSAMQ